MSNRSHRLWYFEAHLSAGGRVAVDAEGATVESADDILKSAYAGTESQAHQEADRRCALYDAAHSHPAKAMSFSPVSTLPT